MDDSDDFEVDDELFEDEDEFIPHPHPFSWRAALGMTFNYFGNLANSTGSYFHGIATECLSSANYDAGRRDFHEEASLAIEQITGELD